MRITSFNINHVNRCLPNLLRGSPPPGLDVVCLQELKCSDGDFPIDAIRRAGYHAVCKGERSWNGIAILAKRREPILIRDVLTGNSEDKQSRYIEAAVEGIAVASIYRPNGNRQRGPKFKYSRGAIRTAVSAGVMAIVAGGGHAVVPGDAIRAILPATPRRALSAIQRLFSTILPRQGAPDPPAIKPFL